MKLISPSIIMFLFLKNFNLNLIFISMLILMLMTNCSVNFIKIFNQMFMLDNLSNILSLLTLMSIMLIMLSSNFFKKMNMMMFPIFIILILTFSLKNLFHFYIFFEMVLIPTLILITSLGKQPERLQAGIYLLMYTILASLPLLINIMFLNKNVSFFVMFMSLYNMKMILLLMIAFLVKMPMFFTHLWLPKAHVEAPLEGSMILAAVLLKLGGYGLIRIIPLSMTKLNLISIIIISISIMGASFTSLNCIRQKDMKSLIAYSSVAHMAFTLISLMTFNSFGITGAIIMMVAHGLSSSALFFLANDLYLKTHSRNIILFKSLMTITPNITFWWFMFMAVNISAPPTINTISEMIILSSMMMWSNILMIPVMMASLLGASFSLYFLVSIIHNKIEIKPFNNSKQKNFLILFMHLIPLIMMLFKLELML